MSVRRSEHAFAIVALSALGGCSDDDGVERFLVFERGRPPISTRTDVGSGDVSIPDGSATDAARDASRTSGTDGASGPEAGAGGAPSDGGLDRTPAGSGGSRVRPVVDQITAGYSDTCVRIHDAVRCWGAYSETTLPEGDNYGDAPNEMGAKLPPANFLGPVRSLSTGSGAGCAILKNDSIQCIGGDLFFKSPGGALGPVDDLAVSYRDACVLKNGAVSCWGLHSEDGELGLGSRDGQSPTDSMMPADLGTGFVPKSVFCGSMAFSNPWACAISTDGRLKCWGGNSYGNLGIGAPAKDNRGDEPGEMGDALPVVDLGTGVKVKSVALSHHACALLDDGAVKCWGGTYSNALGYETAASNEYVGDDASEMGDALPRVPLDGKAVFVGVGGAASCALLEDGRVQCWGTYQPASAARGAGVDTVGTMDFGSGRTAKQLAVGQAHACAVLDDDAVKCWGRNASGQLGLGDTVDRNTPEQMGDALPEVDLTPYDGTPPPQGKCGFGAVHLQGSLGGVSYKADAVMPRSPYGGLPLGSGFIDWMSLDRELLFYHPEGQTEADVIVESKVYPIDGLFTIPDSNGNLLCVGTGSSLFREGSEWTVDLRGSILGNCKDATPLTEGTLSFCVNSSGACIGNALSGTLDGHPLSETTGSISDNTEYAFVAFPDGYAFWFNESFAAGTIYQGLVFTPPSSPQGGAVYCVTSGTIDQAQTGHFVIDGLSKLGACPAQTGSDRITGCVE